MAASFSAASFFTIPEENQNEMNQQNSSSSTTPPAPPPQKKRRNQPGTPYPDAEVIALSPRSLMATNRFVCEVCQKGFQREQNLQLHRRGHNLPWKLKQKSNKEPKRKVYLCPEPSCVHHDPSRALGDLTGIKKHFSRKHGEKKWKCEKCSKKYAVQSDWKAHSKTCGTREYRCDCGTLFSRRDSFITHRAFCDALAQESSRQPQLPTLITNTSINNSQLFGNISNNNMSLALSQIPQQQISSTHNQNDTNQSTEILRFGNHNILSPPPQHPLHTPPFNFITQPPNQNFHHHDQQSQTFQGLISLSELNNNNLFSENFNHEEFFSQNPLMCDHNNNQTNPISPHMSATALLQKASQMGATSSTNNNNNTSASSLLRSYGSSSSSSSLATKVNGGDGLTRDFLGVGQIVMRNMNGGVSQREQRNFNVEAEKNAAAFGSGGNFE
ncbi:protein indeterminate-domain 5, chloroplastic-like [Vicia villosa]|uniref:protein indeterminate-domain 5, chloroplastic-like n=1 Tax=Vicia villosa TaxID=3911 RepID=UPI00273C72DD|nr:protein indeterminate-domain 5, chloroplastic-like [Vicia villosa]XP_058724123.1 protein indeterminate-domain 5, chloroplastic-like [Vicia villosa]